MGYCPHCGATLRAGDVHRDHNDCLKALNARLAALERPETPPGFIPPRGTG